MNTSFPVYAKHFSEGTNGHHQVRVNPEDIVSNRIGTPGNWRPGEYFHNGEFLNVTPNKIHRTTIHDRLTRGYLSQVDDYDLPGPDNHSMTTWHFAGEDARPDLFDVMPKQPDLGYIEGLSQVGIFLPHERDTKVSNFVTKDLVNAVDINRTGYHHSKARGFKDEMKDMLFDKDRNYNSEFAEWVEFLAENGLTKQRSAGIVGVGNHVDTFVAAIYQNEGFMVRADDFERKVKSLTGELDPDSEVYQAAKRYAIMHEIAHHLGVKGDRRGEELQGILAHEFYSKMAEKHKGTKMEKAYRTLASMGKGYAKSYSRMNSFLVDFLGEKKATMEQKYIDHFYKEAEAMGMCQEDADAYVKDRFENDVFSATQKNRDGSKLSNLETLMDESDEYSVETDSEGRTYVKHKDASFKVNGEGENPKSSLMQKLLGAKSESADKSSYSGAESKSISKYSKSGSKSTGSKSISSVSRYSKSGGESKSNYSGKAAVAETYEADSAEVSEAEAGDGEAAEGEAAEASDAAE